MTPWSFEEFARAVLHELDTEEPNTEAEPVMCAALVVDKTTHGARAVLLQAVDFYEVAP